MSVSAQDNLPKVPCTIVTGFLGAGKTTLIRNLLATSNGRRLALIVNEFGDVGVDGDILRSCGIDNCPDDAIVELSNGCICCTVADDFVPALEKLLALPNRPEHIVIETSGLALPKPLVKAFNWPDIRSRVTVDGVVAVVDGAAVAAGRFADDPEELKRQAEGDASLDHDNPLEEVYEDQLLCADLVVLNKADLLSAPEIDGVEKDIEKTVPRAVKVVRTTEGRIDAAVLLGLGAAAEDDLAARPSHHDHEAEHEHDDFDTFVVDLPAILEADALITRLKAAAEAHDILRIKGFVSVEGKPMRLLVQGVGGRFSQHFDRAWAPGESRASRLVIIGEKGMDQAGIRKALEH